MAIYKHDGTDRTIEVGEGYAWWVLFFGAFWFWTKGMIARGFLYALLAIFTLSISWFIVPAFAFKDYEKHLVEKGWKKQ